jgi:hypothetical protein
MRESDLVLRQADALTLGLGLQKLVLNSGVSKGLDLPQTLDKRILVRARVYGRVHVSVSHVAIPYL